MFHPVFVHHAQQHHTLHLTHDGSGEFLLLLFVEVSGGGDKPLGQLLGSQGGQLLLADLYRVLGEVNALKAPQQFFALGGVDVGLVQEDGVDLIGNGGAHHVHDGVLHVHAVQHLLALTVDDLALLVHHVVILQHRLTGLEVAGLHRGLGLLDGLGEQLVLNGHILLHIEPLHHVGDPVAAEQTHQIVLQRDVEPGLAGVALTAGTAPQLVVDTAGIVPLGADDKQAAGLTDLLGLASNLILVLLQALGKQLTGV